MQSNKPVILALTDSKAGHETQTQGIVQLLNQQQAYQVEWIHLTIPNKWQYRLLKWFLPLLTSRSLSYFVDQHQLEKIRQYKVAYIVSAGGNTLLANALLKKELLKYGDVKNIVASSLRGIKATYFDVVFTIHAAQAALEHYLYYPIAPNKMCALPLTQLQARSNLGLNSSDQVIAVLIGADTKTVGIGSAHAWGTTLHKIRSEYPDARLLVTTSRRTPIEFEQALTEYCEQKHLFKNTDQITWVAQGQQCDIKDYIVAADWVLSSADSTSMVAEVVMSGRSLVILCNESGMNDVQIQYQLHFLAQQRWLYLYQLSDAVNLQNIIPMLTPKNHSQALAKKMEQNLQRCL